MPGLPDLESGIAGREVVLLRVAGPVRNVALAVVPERRSVAIDSDDLDRLYSQGVAVADYGGRAVALCFANIGDYVD